MFSIDNFLFDHMPAKSRTLLDELCDPELAYWPHDTLAWRSPKHGSNRQMYNRWVNNLMDEILDTPKEIEMEIERHQPVEHRPKEQPMELENTEVKSKEPCKDKSVEVCKGKEIAKEDKKAMQPSKPTELSLRFGQYKPEEITCVVKDNQLTIKGKKQKKTANSFCSQSFERTFTLPEDADHKNILCSMDANGLIKLNIPNKKVDQESVKEIKINHEVSEVDSKPTKSVDDDEPIVEDLVEEQ